MIVGARLQINDEHQFSRLPDDSSRSHRPFQWSGDFRRTKISRLNVGDNAIVLEFESKYDYFFMKLLLGNYGDPVQIGVYTITDLKLFVEEGAEGPVDPVDPGSIIGNVFGTTDQCQQLRAWHRRHRHRHSKRTLLCRTPGTSGLAKQPWAGHPIGLNSPN
ncbi:MAG: hypothetical protein MZU97_24520 [Bacillus subtilis]|nr:hypothetical protein [Bacillus subtilis]